MKKPIMVALSALLIVPAALLAGEGSSCSWHKGGIDDASSPVEKSAIQTAAKSINHRETFPEISREELLDRVEESGVFIIDANSREKYQAGHIPGAVRFEFESRTVDGILPLDKNTLIVAYCGGPGCEAWNKPAEELHKRGFKNIRHYPGGIKEWMSTGMKVEKAGKEG